jgi:chondroitin AC lyase
MKKIFLVLCLLVNVAFAQNNPVSQPHRSIPVAAGPEKADDDLELIRKRVTDDLLEASVNVESVETLVHTQKADGTWPGINYVDLSRLAFDHSQHLDRILQLARAFKTPKSPFFGKIEVKDAASKALDYWIDHDFICENWWWNEMGVPNAMADILLVLDTDLTERQRLEGVGISGRANLEASGARPGADLIQIAGMRGKQALFQRNAAELETVFHVMDSEIKITTGRGIKPDMSFHHRADHVISTVAYGTGYASAFAYWAVKITGTKYKLPEPSVELLIDFFLDGICQSMVYGLYPELGAENRGITRKGAFAAMGPDLAENLLAATTYRREELLKIIEIRKGDAKSDKRKDVYFWHSHYYSHQRPTYFASVRMYSDRGYTVELPHNEEGIKNHHYADGSSFISITGKEYYDIFPVWDWQKIPGTTILQKADLPHWKEIAQKGLTDFVGATTDGAYGAAAFDFESVDDPLKAKKAWFFFEKEYVSLGAGIQSTGEGAVVTTLNQCLMDGKVVVNGKTGSQDLIQSDHTLADVRWVHHGQVAYIFPSATSINISNHSVSGNWRQINHQAWATSEEVKEDVFKLWIDHGMKPVDAGYAYITVPNITSQTVDLYNKANDITILANTPDLQAVRHRSLQVTEAVFYKPGKLRLDPQAELTVENPCILIVAALGAKITRMTVSDPTAKLKEIVVRVTGRYAGEGDTWAWTWNPAEKISTLRIQLPVDGLAGQSKVVKF